MANDTLRPDVDPEVQRILHSVGVDISVGSTPEEVPWLPPNPEDTNVKELEKIYDSNLSDSAHEPHVREIWRIKQSIGYYDSTKSVLRIITTEDPYKTLSDMNPCDVGSFVLKSFASYTVLDTPIFLQIDADTIAMTKRLGKVLLNSRPNINKCIRLGQYSETLFLKEDTAIVIRTKTNNNSYLEVSYEPSAYSRTVKSLAEKSKKKVASGNIPISLLVTLCKGLKPYIENTIPAMLLQHIRFIAPGRARVSKFQYIMGATTLIKNLNSRKCFYRNKDFCDLIITLQPYIKGLLDYTPALDKTESPCYGQRQKVMRPESSVERDKRIAKEFGEWLKTEVRAARRQRR